MRSLCLCLLLFAAALRPAVADVTGKWSGSFIKMAENGEHEDDRVVLNLKQNGSEITGTAGASEQEQYDIRNGKLEGDKLTFEIAPHGDGPRMRFDLTVTGDRIGGNAHWEGGNRTMKAKLDVTRQKD